MNKSEITVTLSLEEFDKLRETQSKIEGFKNQYLTLIEKLDNCVTFDMAEYDKECEAIDSDPKLVSDKAIHKAVLKAESKIKIYVDTAKLKAMIIDLDLAGVNISKSAKPTLRFSQEVEQYD